MPDSKSFAVPFAASIVGFLAILIVIVIFIDWRLEQNDPTHSSVQYRVLFDPRTSADVLIVGSSTTVHGYVPMRFATIASTKCDFYRTYNFGYMGAQPPFFDQWYKGLYRSYHPAPSLLLISLDWFSGGAVRDVRNDQLGEYRLAQDARYLPLRTWLSLFLNFDSKGKRVLLFNTLRLVRSGYDIRYVITPRRPQQTEGYQQGYLPLHSSIEDVAEGTRVFSVTPEYLSSLKRLILTAQKEGTSVLLIQFPTYLPERIEDIGEAAMYSKLSQELHVPYINYNEPHYLRLNQNPTIFADWSHLNHSGALLFDSIVEQDLRLMIENGAICH